jgi:phosphorylcholine metabolism protein LicD
MNHEHALQDLKIVYKIFKKLKLPLILMYGTALGAYRDHKFLPDEQDIDIATFDEKNKVAIWNELEKKGFVKRRGHKDLEGKIDFRYLPVNRQVMFDLFLLGDNGDHYASWANDSTICATLPKKFSEFEEIKFYGMKFLIPAPTDDFLKETYGDWKNNKLRNHGR